MFIVIQKPNSNKVFLSYSYLILKKMKSSRRLAENDIITRATLSKSSGWQCAGITKIRLAMPRVKLSRTDRNPWLAKMRGDKQVLFSFFLGGM